MTQRILCQISSQALIVQVFLVYRQFLDNMRIEHIIFRRAQSQARNPHQQSPPVVNMTRVCLAGNLTSQPQQRLVINLPKLIQ